MTDNKSLHDKECAISGSPRLSQGAPGAFTSGSVAGRSNADSLASQGATFCEVVRRAKQTKPSVVGAQCQTDTKGSKSAKRAESRRPLNIVVGPGRAPESKDTANTRIEQNQTLVPTDAVGPEKVQQGGSESELKRVSLALAPAGVRARIRDMSHQEKDDYLHDMENQRAIYHRMRFDTSYIDAQLVELRKIVESESKSKKPDVRGPLKIERKGSPVSEPSPRPQPFPADPEKKKRSRKDANLSKRDRKKENEVEANFRKAKQASGKNIVCAGEEEKENFHAASQTAGPSSGSSDRVRSQLLGILKEKPVLEKPRESPLDPSRKNGPRYALVKYMTKEYVGDDMTEALMKSTRSTCPDAGLTIGRGLYLNETEAMVDERMQEDLVTRCKDNTAIKMNFYWVKVDWVKLMTSFTRLFSLIVILSIVGCLVLPAYRLFGSAIDRLLFGPYNIVRRWTWATCYVLGMPPYIARLLAGASFWCAVVLFDDLVGYMIENWSCQSVHWMRRLAFKVYVEPYLYLKHDKRFDAKVSAWHLEHGLSENIDYNHSLIASKMKARQYYIGDTLTIFGSKRNLYHCLSMMLRVNIFYQIEEVDTTNDILRCDDITLKMIHKLKMFGQALPRNFITRVYGLVSLYFLGNCENMKAVEINRDTCDNAYSKRCLGKQRPALSADDYGFIYSNWLGTLNIAPHSCGQPVDLATSMKDYALDYSKRHMLSASETAHWVDRAVKLSGESPEVLLAHLERTLKVGTKWMIKDEFYNVKTKKPSARFIVCPDIDLKLIFGTILRPVEEAIYHSDYLKDRIIKHKVAEEIETLFKEGFGDNGSYLETDYSGFESSIRKEELDIEFALYKHYAPDDAFSQGVLNIVHQYHLKKGKKLKNNKLGTLHMDDMRLSGFCNTALGNLLLNWGNIALAYHKTLFRRGLDISRSADLKFMVEGDDAIIKFPSDEIRTDVLTQMTAQRFIVSDDEVFSNGKDASFCGYHLVDDEIQPTDDQLSKMALVFAPEGASPEYILTRGVARICSYYAKFPRHADVWVLAAKRLLEDFPESRVHGSKLRRHLSQDYLLQENDRMREAAMKLAGRIVRGEL